MKKLLTPALASLMLPIAATAASFEDQYGNKFEISGFTKHEWNKNPDGAILVPDNLSRFTYDSRNAISAPPLAQTTRSPKSSQLSMQQVSLGWSRETEGAVGLEARATYRWRTDDATVFFDRPDVDYRPSDGAMLKTDFTEAFFGVSRPDLGALKLGTQLSRSWSRSDAFSFPIGLSNAWADSGAGFGIFPKALRVTSPMFVDGSGKLVAEMTLATHKRNTFLVEQNRLTSTGDPFSPNPTIPKALEIFLQFSDNKNLIELTVQSAKGAKQSAFGKSALIGWIGDPDTIPGLSSTPRNASAPNQSVVVLQGNHWPNPQNMFTWGLRRSQWSGSAASCNFNNSLGTCLFGLDPGFNYGPASESYLGFKARSFDALLGWSHYRGVYTYTIGAVYFGTASSENPIEWGQSNSAMHLNLGVARKVPEIHKGLTVAWGVSASHFNKIGPAPLSMPNNNFLNSNPLYERVGYGSTIGLTWVF